jgi:hypothetical protein
MMDFEKHPFLAKTQRFSQSRFSAVLFYFFLAAVFFFIGSVLASESQVSKLWSWLFAVTALMNFRFWGFMAEFTIYDFLDVNIKLYIKALASLTIVLTAYTVSLLIKVKPDSVINLVNIIIVTLVTHWGMNLLSLIIALVLTGIFSPKLKPEIHR